MSIVTLDRAAAERVAGQSIASLPLNLTINGERRTLQIEPWTTLLDFEQVKAGPPVDRAA